jgi:phospholipase/carboxylesterase
VLLGHGTYDPVVDVSLGDLLRSTLEARGYQVEWHTYPMVHTVSIEELNHLVEWLRRVIDRSPTA